MRESAHSWRRNRERERRSVRRGWQRARWTGELALFGSGVFTLPALSVVLADTASGDVWRLSSDPAVVAVVPRDLDSAADIEADEPPVEISGGIPPWAWAILLPAAAALVAFLLRRRRLRLEAALPPHVRCLREIDRLLARGDGSSDDQARHNAFCLALGLALRGYLDERFGTRRRRPASSSTSSTRAPASWRNGRGGSASSAAAPTS